MSEVAGWRVAASVSVPTTRGMDFHRFAQGPPSRATNECYTPGRDRLIEATTFVTLPIANMTQRARS
jgi:hypothetical protein